MNVVLLERVKLAAEGAFLVAAFAAIAHFADPEGTSPVPLAADDTAPIAVAQAIHGPE